MTPASRGKGWWGLGLVLILGILGVLYLTGVVQLNLGAAKPKALCYVSPKNPNFIKEAPGKDPEGNDPGSGLRHPGLRPPPPRPQPPSRKTRPSIGTVPCIRKSSRPTPANAPNAAWTWCRLRPRRPRPPRPKPSARSSTGSSHGPRLCPGQTRQGPLRHGPGAGL